MAEMTLTEIAKEIGVYLKRFEADPTINVIDKRYGTSPFYYVNAYRGGKYVCVRYVSYQSTWNLTKSQAIQYLEWLRAGNIGPHYTMEDKLK